MGGESPLGGRGGGEGGEGERERATCYRVRACVSVSE